MIPRPWWQSLPHASCCPRGSCFALLCPAYAPTYEVMCGIARLSVGDPCELWHWLTGGCWKVAPAFLGKCEFFCVTFTQCVGFVQPGCTSQKVCCVDGPRGNTKLIHLFLPIQVCFNSASCVHVHCLFCISLFSFSQVLPVSHGDVDYIQCHVKANFAR